MAKNTTIGSLYSGIAGLELGLLAAFAEAGAPARVAWQCEIDPFASRVLAHHFPDVQRFSDVATVHNPPSVDILCGGFACQDVSSAGRNAGLGRETRSGFTLYHLLRIIGEVRPRFVVIENVASGAKRWLPCVVQELRDRGYRPRAVPLGAVDVGAPHRRLRVFVVADRDGAASRGFSGLRNGERPTFGDNVDGCGQGVENVADTASQRRKGANRKGDAPGERGPLFQSEQRGDAGGDRGAPQSRMGCSAHGLPFDVAGHVFPAGRGENQRAWESPRALAGDVRVPDRPAKLRALGNAVVPQCALVVGRILVARGAAL